MTKPLAGAALALLALALLPAASAHGAPPVREVDTRVLADDDGLPGYGGCAGGACPPGAGGGLDLLALDVREAWLAGGEPAVVFRILFQSAEPAAGASLVLHVDGPAGTREFRADTADGAAFTPVLFDRLDGPFDVGDGHPKAVDGWVRASTLGAAAGDALTGLWVASFRGEAQDDAMPGGWFANGVEVLVPPAEAVPGTYTLGGPAELVTLSAADLPAAAPMHGPAKVTLTLANAVGLQQFANLTVTAPAGATARLSAAGLVLAGNASRTVELTVDADADGTVQVAALTDLGGWAVASVAVKAPTHGMDGSATATGSHSHSSTAPASKDSPAPGLGVLAALAAVALLLRRRA